MQNENAGVDALGGGLAYFTIFPLWKIWGYTIAKDTWYYILLLLLVLVLIDIRIGRYERVVWWQWLLLALAPGGACLAKGNGLFVLVLTFATAILCDRRRWKLYIVGILAAVIPISVQNYIVMPRVYGVSQVPVSETMTIPLQQTARYLSEHFDDMTEEEREILQDVFTCPLEEIPEDYRYEISDDVKSNFVLYPTREQLGAYYRVWFSQFCRHPSTYIQAFINQTYGYFYPDREMFNDAVAQYYIYDPLFELYFNHWMDIHFGIRDGAPRDLIMNMDDLLYRLPVTGMLFSAGFYNYILLGCLFYMLNAKRAREAVILLPALAVVLINLFSPVNAYLRYMLPVLAMTPFLVAWCYYAVRGGEKPFVFSR